MTGAGARGIDEQRGRFVVQLAIQKNWQLALDQKPSIARADLAGLQGASREIEDASSYGSLTLMQ